MENKKQLIEDALISGKSIDDLIKIKMQAEMQSVFSKIVKKSEKQRVFDIKKVPEKMFFSRNAVYKKFNKINKTVSFINGIQAEALLALDECSRRNLLKGDIEAFSTENAFVKFEYVDIICEGEQV